MVSEFKFFGFSATHAGIAAFSTMVKILLLQMIIILLLTLINSTVTKTLSKLEFLLIFDNNITFLLHRVLLILNLFI